MNEKVQSHNVEESEKIISCISPFIRICTKKTNRVYSGLSLSFVKKSIQSNAADNKPTNQHEWTQDLQRKTPQKKMGVRCIY